MGALKTGGQGSVYKGRRTMEVITAIKLLPTPIVSENEEDKHYRDFANEVKKLQRVNEEPNPNVVKILSYGVSETGGFPFIEMEYIDGPDLAELLKLPHPPVFTVKEIIKVADHLSNALAHCHRLDVKHGDMKSNNVKFNKQTGNYVLLDFGLAILSDEERRTSMRHAGAVEFMAPEQNEGRTLFQTDVYSFGIILYELLAGQVPFLLDGNSETARNKVMIAHLETPPPDPLSLREAAMPTDWSEKEKARERQVPEWLVSLVYKCLKKKPEDRFANGIELHNYISHHRIYTAEVAGLVKQEDREWETVLAEKEAELNGLRSLLAQQRIKQASVRASDSTVGKGYKQKGVSRPAFNALLILLFLVGAVAVYRLFFNKSAMGGAGTDTAASTQDSLQAGTEKTNTTISENRGSAKRADAVKISEKRKRQSADSIEKTLQTKDVNPRPLRVKEDSSEEEGTRQSTKEADAGNENNGDNLSGDNARYKVRNVAYFHNQPEADTRRAAFINHWNNAVLKPLDDKNGFIYIVYTNEQGQTSKGWLSKSDLIKVR